MKLSRALDYFYNSIIADGKAEVTLVWYQQRLKRLYAFLGDIDIESVTINDLRGFVVSLRAKKSVWGDNSFHPTCARSLSVATIHSYVRAVKRLFNWLEFEGYITTAENPAIRLKKPKLPKSEPKNITAEDFRALLGAVNSTKFPERNRAILLFLADTGVRVGGLVGLRVQDLKLSENMAMVTEKGLKSRYVFFGDETKEALQQYLDVRASSSEYLWIGQRGRLTISGVRVVLRRLTKIAGVTGRTNAHAFRHFFAKRYLQNGGDLATLADLMGHSDVVVTKNSYSIFLTDELKRKHKEHSGMRSLLDTE